MKIMNSVKTRIAIVCALLLVCLSAYAIDGVLYANEIIVEPSVFQEFLDKNTLGGSDFNDFIREYKFIEISYNPPVSELNFLLNLVLEGYAPNIVIEAYNFWRDTSEDITIVRNMCDRYNTEDRYWTENAFNACTYNKNGVLDAESVGEYIGAGLDREDIEIANVLSRRGKLTVQQILEKRKGGVEFGDILSDVETERIDKGRAKKIKLPKEKKAHILKARDLAEMTNGNVNVYLEQASSGTDLDAEIDKKLMEIDKRVNKEIKELLKKEDKFTPEQIEANESIIRAIEETGITRDQINGFLNDHTLWDIYQASMHKFYNGTPIEEGFAIVKADAEKAENNEHIEETGQIEQTDAPEGLEVSEISEGGEVNVQN